MMNSRLDYERLLDMEVEFVAELGQTTLTLGDILKLTEGSLIDLGKPAGERIESYVNNRMIGKGEVMVRNSALAVRIHEVLDSSTVLNYLSKERP